MTGSDAPGIDDPVGSIIIANLGCPSLYVEINVAKSATSVRALKSSKLGTCNVLNSDDNLVYANFKGLASKMVIVIILCKNAKGFLR